MNKCDPTAAAPVRVLIVDDSATMRAALNRILSRDPCIEVVGTAIEPNMARAMIKDLNPDVVTLDVEMPGMDGLTFLERIMRLRPMPVVMVSSLTAHGAETTIAALRLGAVDCVAKPGLDADIASIGAELCKVVRNAAQARVRPRRPQPAPVYAPAGDARDCIIGIGASTGGVEALFELLASLPVGGPPVLVVQHMPASFTPGFAARLNAECAINVVEAKNAALVLPGMVYIAPGGDTHMRLGNVAPGAVPRIALAAGEKVAGHRPSVDVLFQSMVSLGPAGIGVILTGMGSDGAAGLAAMRTAGAHTIGQDAASCVVHGMPRAAMAAGAIAAEMPLSAIPRAIVEACRS